MKSLPWLRVACALVCGGLALFFLWHAPWLQPRAVIENCLDDDFEFSPDSQRLVAWSGAKVFISSTIHLNEPGIHSYDVATGLKQFTFEGSEEAFVMALIFSPDGRFAAGSARSRVAIWETSTGQRKSVHDRDVDPRFFFSPDGELLFDSSDDEKRGITTSVPDGKTIVDFRSLIEDAFPNAELGPLAAYATAKEVRVVDRSTAGMLHVFPWPQGDRPGNLELWANGKILTGYTGIKDRECHIWMAPEQEPKRRGVSRFETRVLISPDGQWLACSEPVTQWTWIERVFADWFHKPLPTDVLRVDRLENGENIALIRNGLDARFSPDGRTLAVSFADGRIELWDFPLRKPTLLIVLLSVLVSMSVYTGSRWWQKRRRAVQTAAVAPSGLRPVGTADNSPAR